MRLGGKVDDRSYLVLSEQAFDERAVGDVALHKEVPRIPVQWRKVAPVARVSELVEVHHRLITGGQPVEHEIGTDKTGAASDENHGQLEGGMRTHRLWQRVPHAARSASSRLTSAGLLRCSNTLGRRAGYSLLESQQRASVRRAWMASRSQTSTPSKPDLRPQYRQAKSDGDTTMATWTPFPNMGSYTFDATQLTQQWARLHTGDAEPLPQDDGVLQAWVHFHNGQFQEAAAAGLKAGGAGITAANKAMAIHATYLETKEKMRLELFTQIAEQALALARAEPGNANAWYCYAYAMGRYSQGISVAKALAQGLGNKVRESLEKTIALSPTHADAHIALGAFHAEVIDKVGALIGGMTYGVRKDKGLRLFQEALRLNPGSAIAMVEYAKALMMLEGDKKMAEATALYQRAAACEPLDATERLDVDMARAELND